jgi:hypothetical protein
MTLNLSNYEEKVTQAVRAFWGNREAAARIQAQAGRRDQGERAGVTAGGNMNGFRDLAMDIARDNGLTNASILFQRNVLTLPGFFRPTKQWDMLVLNNGGLVAALEFKSQVGPSFGNNFNNRTEEAIGTAHDLWLAYREGAFGQDAPRPFLGWFILVEDAPGSAASSPWSATCTGSRGPSARSGDSRGETCGTGKAGSHPGRGYVLAFGL